MREADDMVYFKKYQKGLSAPFVIYEAITEKIYGCQPNNDKSYTTHVVYGMGQEVLF